MFNKIYLSLITTIAILFLSSCGHTQKINLTDVDSLKEVACLADTFLQENGYLEEIMLSKINTSTLSLELWDQFNYEKNGVFNWSGMLANRANTFSKKLYGVNVKGNDHLIYYDFSDYFRCISIENSTKNIHLHEANCLASDTIFRIEESELNCI